MMTSIRRSMCVCLVISAIGAVCGLAKGQANFFESFDNAGDVNGGQLGPSALISRGWLFRRQGSPQGSGTWNAFGAGFSYEGAGCLYVDSSITQVNGTGAGWAVLPAIPGQRAGDPITFWSAQGYSTAGSPTGSLQLRYSPNAGTSTGSNATDAGDFSQVLVDIPANPDGLAWTRFQANLPGTGRLALRFYQPSGSSSTDYASNFRIDSLRVGAPVGGVPFPTAGQSVHWTLAMSPVNLPAQHRDIVAGGTVIVDPGVSVNITSGYRLEVHGTLDVRAGSTVSVPATSFPPSEINVYGLASFVGTAASPVSIIGGARDWAATTERVGAMPGGKIVASYVNLQSTLSALNSGIVIADHITASGQYTGFFTSGQIYTTGGTIALRDATLSNGAWININGGYLLIDRVTLDNAQVYTSRYRGGQTLYFNNIAARNQPDSCFHLTGYDHFFGPNNTITSNGFPVHLYGAGIAHGSTLPASGNSSNIVHAGIGTMVGQGTLANAGLPYRIDRDDSMPDNMGGQLIVEPGVTVKMGPGAYIPASFGSELRLKGLPESPITFERLDPAQPWTDLWFAVSHVRPRVEHCILRGADRGVDADESLLRVESCLFENNRVGVNARNYLGAIIRNSRFFGNVAGAQSSYGAPASGFGHAFIDADVDDGKPNWFQNNTSGLETLNPLGDLDFARGNFWGAPTGPRDPSNPGGTGDATPGPNVVVPFLTSPPDFNDHPPVVRLQDHSFLIEEGDKFILHWTARDERPITKFQIWHSAHGDNPGLRLIVDDIPGDARSREITVPEAPPASNYPDPSAFRVVAFDASGQQGYDELICTTPWLHDVTGRITSAPMPGLVRPGEPMTVCLGPGENYFDAILALDGDGQSYSLGGTTVNCVSGTSVAPPVSTDLARVIVWRGSAGGRNLYGFSNYFSIRPDASIGDAPPTVALNSPAGGESFAGATIVPIIWTASDDEELRSFDIHASYNNGRTWSTIAHDLPGATRSYNWRLPPSEGIPQVRVRVVAKDLRFQNSSSGGDRTFSISLGQPRPCHGPCIADFDDGSGTGTPDGGVTIDDLLYYLRIFEDGLLSADVDDGTFTGIPDGGVTIDDLLYFLFRFESGC